MKYSLALGIQYKKYKEGNGQISLRVGDRFIESFKLESDYGSVANIQSLMKKAEELQLGDLDPELFVFNYKPCKDFPKFIKIYEIDEKHLQGKLQIDVENSYATYTNGFMGKSSLVKFSLIALFPTHLTEDKCGKFMKLLHRLRKSYVTYKQQKKRVRVHTEVYSNTPPPKKKQRTPWPMQSVFYVKRKNEKHEKSGLKTNTFHGGSPWIGGDFTLEIPLKVKHNTTYLGQYNAEDIGFPLEANFPGPGGIKSQFRAIQVLTGTQPLLNIYNEDQ